MNPLSPRPVATQLILAVLAITVVLVASTSIHAQTTIATGSIQGTVTDPSGAVVSGAKVSIRNKATNQTILTATNSSGAYASGALTPGEYVVRVEAAGSRLLSYR